MNIAVIKRQENLLSHGGSSVFRVPCRQAIEAYKKHGEDAGKRKSKEITGGCLSKQTWAIVEKIAEINDFMQSHKQNIFRKVHPEVCFRSLNGKALNDNKKNKKGTRRTD